MKRFIVLQRKYNFALRRILMVAMLLVSLVLAGCGGQLGNIEPSVVDTAIADAEAAIAAARDIDAASLAPDAFQAATSNLAAAKTALTEKKGNDALRLAYQATADARLAHRHAINVNKNSKLNATILQKEAGVAELRQKLNTQEAEFARVKSEMQTARGAEDQLTQKIRDLEKKNRELNITREDYGKQVAELFETLDDMQTRGKRAETEIRNYGKEISALRRKIDIADKMVKEEGYQKRAAIAEAESLRKQIREQAEIYTQKLAEAGQQGVAAKHAEFLKQQAQASRAYVDSKPPLSPAKTGRTLLSTEQIAAGKVALSNWEAAWQSKNLNVHLAHYEHNIVVDKVVIYESKEDRSKIDRQQLESELRQMSEHTWRNVKTDTEVESESIISVQQMSRLVVPAADENATALYNIWIREVWMHQIGNDWKIHHEIWKIFENVPDF
ncbi:DUF4398 domain-containing protein [Candidatus Poribacteria bacterium]|nr:DUF4398 domain-containing protein [Candidatus Poribacteria bacterium]MYH80816.1 DUF4398 domain-containing protein [Candidatus Poribacteria bacterium]MYK94726.1 DUF4398 domain-containing protein [Candidatus Poribacteria bacterium]